MIKIYTNLKQLKRSDEYLHTVGVDFKYINTNVFSLCQYRPNIIISNDKEEMENACLLHYPLIRFIGKNLNFPCENVDIPDNFLYNSCYPDKTYFKSVLDHIKKPYDIAYISSYNRPCTLKDTSFYYKLSYLGNTKLVGNLSNTNQIANRLSELEIIRFCTYGKVCAFTEEDKEFILPILNHNIPCITDFEHDYCYHIDKIDTINLNPIDGQVEYANKYCIKSFWNNNILNRS
jgi:hypothetical protein